jgi:hypothetical protein
MSTAAEHAGVAVITKEFEFDVHAGSLDLGAVRTGTWAEPVTLTSRETYSTPAECGWRAPASR